MSQTKHPDFANLRKKFDGSDSFVRFGHQIKKILVRERHTPDWTLNETKIRKLIDQVFPKWRVNMRQRERAARWIMVIQLFYRMRWSYSRVAGEMGIRTTTVQNILKRQRRVLQGLQASGTEPRGKPKGRPRKTVTLYKNLLKGKSITL